MLPFWHLTNQQDWDISKWQQKGVDSIGYEPGPLSEQKEYNVDAFIRWYDLKRLHHGACIGQGLAFVESESGRPRLQGMDMQGVAAPGAPVTQEEVFRVFADKAIGYGVPAIAFLGAGYVLKREREDLAVRICDALGVLFKRKLDLHQTTFAMGEAVAHLHALWFEGKLRRSRDEA